MSNENSGTLRSAMNVSIDSVLCLIEGTSTLNVDDSTLELIFWTMHPRYKFFKSLPINAKMLDIGANNGGLHYWRDWGHPRRSDIALYGVDLQLGDLADHYAGWEVLDLDTGRPRFDGVKFDAFYATHLIEHLRDLDPLLSYLDSAAAPGARLFFEWPAPRTKTFPSSALLREHGFDIQTFNFFDDATHVDTYERDDISARLSRFGFEVAEIGEIDIGQIAREHLLRGRLRDNLTWRQMGLWCSTGWCNYVAARRAA